MAAALGAAACARPEPPPAANAASSANPPRVAAAPSSTEGNRHRKPLRHTPLVDSVVQRLVFAPAVDEWFVGTVRDSAFGVDIGRIDFDVQKTPARLAAFHEAVSATSPIAIGSRLRLRGTWGELDAAVAAFEPRAGRVLARVASLPMIDSLARAGSPHVVSVQLVADSAGPSLSRCDRTYSEDLRRRAARAADSLEGVLRRGEQPVFERLQRGIRSRKSHVAGCFGGGARALAIASLYAGDYEWARERAVFLGDSGTKAVSIRDLRLRSHEAIHAFDADGDGLDEVAARGWTPRGGGTVILKLSQGNTLERLAAGFAFER